MALFFGAIFLGFVLLKLLDWLIELRRISFCLCLKNYIVGSGLKKNVNRAIVY